MAHYYSLVFTEGYVLHACALCVICRLELSCELNALTYSGLYRHGKLYLLLLQLLKCNFNAYNSHRGGLMS